MPQEPTFDVKENIIAMLNLGSLPEDKRVAIVDKAGELVQKRVMARVMETLPADQLKQAEALAGDPGTLMSFLLKNIPALPTFFDEELVAVKTDLAALGTSANQGV